MNRCKRTQCGAQESLSPFPSIIHNSFLHHPARYHIVQIIRRYIFEVQAHALILPRLRFSADVNAGFTLVECLREIDEREAKHEEGLLLMAMVNRKVY